MNDDKASFTPRDIQIIRLLAIALGLITCIECLIANTREMLVAVIGLNVVTMIVCPLAIYLLRRMRAK